MAVPDPIDADELGAKEARTDRGGTTTAPRSLIPYLGWSKGPRTIELARADECVGC
jgi:hypothetical protein